MATTLHSWAGLRDGRYTNTQLLELLRTDVQFKAAATRISQADVLVIDEISMISCKVWSQLEFVCRKIRQNDFVFGTLQVVVAGDFRQLKPVPNCLYKDPGDFCFQSPAWKDTMKHIVTLDKVMRQDEPNFIKAIHDLSNGDLSRETDMFLATLSRPLPDNCQPTYLYARNYETSMKCHDILFDLEGPQQTYRAVDAGDSNQLRRLNVPKNLVLKRTCHVMLTVNLSNRLVNGSKGTVTEMHDGSCTVDFAGAGKCVIKPYTFSVFSQDTFKNVASRTQLPLQLCYAITIHKAQGMTLDSVVVNAEHATHSGQLATALGRAKNSKSVQLKHFDKTLIPKQPQPVIDFYSDARAVQVILPDHYCCRYVPYIEEQIVVDHPLGEEPLVVQPDPDDDLHDGPVMGDWELDLVMSQLIGDTAIVTENADELPQLPPAFDLKECRSTISNVFSARETQQQDAMYQKDALLSNPLLSVYLGQLWSKLSDLSKDCLPQNKKCSKSRLREAFVIF